MCNAGVLTPEDGGIVKRGDICEGRVVRVDFPDKAIVVTDEKEEAIVKFGLPGQKVRFRVKKKKRTHTEGILLEVLEKSSEEKSGCCRHFGSCGGCIYQSLPYETQLKIKEEQIKQLLDQVCSDYLFEGIEPSPRTEGYRNKMELSFGDAWKDGPLALGMHQRGSFYDIVCIPDCRIMHEDMKKIADCVLRHMTAYEISFYRKMSHQGVLRHLLLRRSEATGEILAALVTSSQGEEAALHLNELTEKICSLSLEGRIKGFLHIINDSLADIVQSDEMRVLYGETVITEKLLGLSFQITPFSFFQTNSAGAEVLYRAVREYIGETKDKLIFDLYSGTGTIAQILAPVAGQVIGVEIVEEAVAAAKANAACNGLENCVFLAGDVLKVLDKVEKKPDLIILDPPRDGIHPKALPKILDYQVKKIVYVSCKPTSLVRDYEMFVKRGYRMVKARAVDMFPSTAGIETVALFERTAMP